ncbi:exodeoxyribonuclease V subunit gamma [Kineococcus terrestris]|uniref:exodeoxyribonuclease V subunit gamma n=1 Tax=Kineococcus terrestris TaxID=2044856 RepID=UPI0034DAEB10
MLHVHRSASADVLVAALADLLRAPGAEQDPFAPEVVAVGARGTERWVAQRLSHHLGVSGGDGADDGVDDGVCAGVAMPDPAQLLDDALAAAGPEHAAAVEGWRSSAATWHVLEVLDDLAGPAGADERFAVLRHHLRPADGGGPPRVRRLAAAERIAGLLARYGAARPALLAGWARGEDGPVPADLRWQPELFRRVRERAGVPHPAELLGPACERLRADPGASALPERFSVLAVTRLAAARLAVLAALAEHREAHLWLHHPSPALWEAVRAGLGAPGGVPVRRAEREEADQRAARHPLLLSLARDVRELQVRLALAAPGHADVPHDEPVAPAASPALSPDAPLLARLRAQLAADEVPADPPPPAPGDRSVQVHACHGRARQVEVLREVLLGLLADDPTLQPRDVVVLCPDVEVFAPLVAAVFGTGSHPGAALRVTVADRSPLQTNPLLGVATRLLALAGGRVGATEVLDLAGLEPVRLRFGLDDDALEGLRDWTVGAGVHWGLGAGHRDAWQLGHLAQGSWRAGLDRLLTGVAVGGAEDGGLLLAGGDGAVVPLDDVESSRVELAGVFAELLDRLETAVLDLSGARPVADWCDALAAAVLALTDVPRDGAWQQAQLRRELAAVRDESARAGSAPVTLADVTALLTARFAGRPQRAGFRTGAVTVCTMVPMRAVPHRVVVLLGLDDGAFPRVVRPDADDLLARDPHVGDRDPRSEDRQVLLDAVGAAGQHLVVLHSGCDVRTGAPVPPAVPVGELLDALDACATVPGGRVRDRVLVQHPLQPTDPRNFVPGALGADRAVSFDTAAHAGARAAQLPPRPVPALLPAALPPPGEDELRDLDLDALVQFWQHPVRGLLRQRLEVGAAAREEGPEDALPVALDGLREWAVGDRVLRARLAGTGQARVAQLERARGDLPPGLLGTAVLRRVGERADRIAAAAAAWAPAAGSPSSVDVEVDLPGGTRLTGAVRGVREVAGAAAGDVPGPVALTITYSSVRAKQRLRAWVELLALSAAHADRSWTAVVVGRGDRDGVSTTAFGPVPAGVARELLADLVALRRVGLCVPLPAPVATAGAYAAARARGTSTAACEALAAKEWVSGYGWPREDADEEHRLVWGESAPFTALRDWRPPPDAPPGTPGGFDELCRRVWQPLLRTQRTWAA